MVIVKDCIAHHMLELVYLIIMYIVFIVVLLIIW